MGLPIRSSHLAIRFYRHDGWSEEVVRSCMNRGDLKFFDDRVGELDMAYWVGMPGSLFNIDRLLELSGRQVWDHNNNLIEIGNVASYLKELAY